MAKSRNREIVKLRSCEAAKLKNAERRNGEIAKRRRLIPFARRPRSLNRVTAVHFLRFFRGFGRACPFVDNLRRSKDGSGEGEVAARCMLYRPSSAKAVKAVDDYCLSD
eukprot:scaffold1178_cov252-Pinguiococcus_pyrenoidosus.AAC.23